MAADKADPASDPRSDARFMGAALALAERGMGLASPNPSVGCVLVKDGVMVGRGWTQAGGRPHAEAMALQQAGEKSRGATAYVTLEPCAHTSPRGPCCTDLLIKAGVSRVVAALTDPDPRTAGQGFAALRSAGVGVTEGVAAPQARFQLGGFLSRTEKGRPLVTLKLATTLDGQIAMADGSSRWITGERARAHAHLERARHDAILVGRGTLERDDPRLDVRLTGLEARAPKKLLLSAHRSGAPDGWALVPRPEDIATLASGSVPGLEQVQSLLIEGGAWAAAAFLKAGLVDRLLLYRAPILIGIGKAALGDIGLGQLDEAHGRWRLADTRRLGKDRVELYEAIR